MNSIQSTTRRLTGWRVWLAAALALTLTACGGGSSDTVTTPVAGNDEGIVYIGLTDAEGDFDSYLVDVLSVALERADGTQVETLPLETRVDFTELTEVTEFLSIATVPAGNYVAASIRLDFADAQIIVQDDSGNLAEALAVDSAGQPLGEYSLRLSLANSDVIRIAPGIPAAFSLDFDLDASNRIDFAASPTQVIVEPFLMATATLEEDREHRVRGVLASVDEAAATATLIVRPFFHRAGNFGRFDVAVDDDTQYEIDGEGFTGSEGLAALAALDPRSPVVANGSVSLAERAIQADVVIAGSSVPWANANVVKGVVTARDGDVLSIRGGLIEFADGRVQFAGDLSVLVGTGTSVSAPGVDNAMLDANSISVGQRIIAFGDLGAERTLDSSDSRVVMLMSQFTAEVTQALPLAADLALFNGRRPGAFDFSGTGSTSEFDADPDFYEVDTGNLTLNGVDAGDLVRVRGLVNAFGAAPADFNARTVINLDSALRAGELTVQWPLDAPSATPFLSTAEDRLNVDISESREWLRVRGIPRPLTNPLEMLTLLATDSGEGAYAIAIRGSDVVTLYRNFADLVDGLNRALADGATLQRIHARVGYTGDSSELVSPRASFVFQPAGE